ncbi:histone-lysine N-methyltransferase 2D-like [Penaeus chinensis]|uniref:histone-lysine N-methyltransferase 2D-like n=1 Tax=Penaeus chinensis TaxID=139456 RepID=UPI001FB61CB6|nr:histone-lysine N-methyltransferase 2D-like [Penaeus chinensis]
MELTLTCIAWLVLLTQAAGENNLTALFHEALSNDGSLQSSVGVSGAMSDLELVYLRRHPTPAPPTIVLSARDKRSGSAGRMSYFFSAFGRNYNLKLEKMSHLVSPGAKMTVVGPRGGVSVAAISPATCHYIHVDDDITAALNACKPGTIAGYIVSRDVTLEVRPLGKRATGILHHAFRKRGAWPSSVHKGIPHVVRRRAKDSQARPSPTPMELEIPPPACSEPISNATPDDLEFGQGELFTIPPSETTPMTPAFDLPGSTPPAGPNGPPPSVPPGRPVEEDPEGVFIPPLPFKRNVGREGDSLSDREPKPMAGFHREPKPVDFDSTPSPPGDREPKPMQGFDREPRPMNRVVKGPPGMDREPKPMQGIDREPKPMREPGQGPDLPEAELNREPKPMQGFDREPRPMNRVLRGPPGMDREPKPMQGIDREPKPMREPGQEPDLPEAELNREPKPMQGFDREPRPMNRVMRGPLGMDREPKPMQGIDREPKPMREPGQEPELPEAELNREPKPMQGFDREPRPMNRIVRGPPGMDREPKPMQGIDREPKPMREPGQEPALPEAELNREPKPMQGFDREPRPMNRVVRGPPGMDREPKPMQGIDREPKPMREPELPEAELNREPKPMQGFDREPRPMNRVVRGPPGMDREPKPMQGIDREPKPMREPGQEPELPEAELNREPKPMQGFDREPRPMNRIVRGPPGMDREPKPMQGIDREPKPMREPLQEPALPETELNREPKPMQGFDREPRVTPTKRNVGKTVELGVFVDQAAHDLFLPYFGSQAALTDVVLGYVNGIQALFHHPSLGQKIHLVINHIEIMAEQPSTLPHYGGDREKLYEAFRLYNEKRNAEAENLVDARPWDMGILISGLNFYSVHKKDGRTSYSTMGLAAVRGVCHPGYSAVIVELGATDTWGKPYPSAGFASVYVMAHEMGHNLGMLHDGYGNACPKNGFVMSASRSTSGETNWSSCSREIVETLSAPCLNDNPPEIPKHDHSVYDQLPGQTWDAYDQCRVFLRDDDATLYNESLAQI